MYTKAVSFTDGG